MPAYLKYRPAWSQLLVFIGLSFAIFMVLSIIGMFILARMTGMGMMEMADVNKWDLTNPNTLLIVRGMLTIQFLCLFLIPVLLFAYFSDPHPMEYLGLKQKTPAFYFAAGILIMILSFPLASWLGILNQSIPFPESMQKWMDETAEGSNKQIEFMLTQKGTDQLLKNLFFIAVFAGVGEELFFRGVIQRLLIRWFKSPWAGILAAAAIFSAIHFQFDGFLPRMMLGIVLGAMYWYSGSLWTAILAHVVYDGVIVIITHFDPSKISSDAPLDMNGLSPAIMGIVSLVLVSALIYWMRKRSTNSMEKVYAGDRAPNDPFSF
ncbi:MAG: CPBP family intramembrane metalloprotease [Chitinophagaceae bacterium]|nr:CPBP family intramembrane metalloprotease [Chitinophagaceae bacterium]MBN8666588.1 CPBP family intramembrane metalloprotease [Chitinophagales bacterium]